MKRSTVTIAVLACLIAILLIVTAFATVSSANAQLGNTGVPVKCTASAIPDSWVDVACLGADGTAFGAVPSNHYFLVTDVSVYPSGPTTGFWEIKLNQYSSYLEFDNYHMSTRTQATFSEHFSVPVLVVPQGKSLKVLNPATSSGGVYVTVIGLLTTNYNYLPLITR